MVALAHGAQKMYEVRLQMSISEAALYTAREEVVGQSIVAKHGVLLANAGGIP